MISSGSVQCGLVKGRDRAGRQEPGSQPAVCSLIQEKGNLGSSPEAHQILQPRAVLGQVTGESAGNSRGGKGQGLEQPQLSSWGFLPV